MSDYIYIENKEGLVDFCRQVEGSPWLAVDTEFEREKTYYPELCLLQIGNQKVTAAIDPLKITDLEPVLELLYKSDIVKVFHSARQDLEIFFHLTGSVPQPLFDTQLAAPLLGYQEQMGYASLVKAMLNVELSKAHTRTDWKRRPLNAGQLRYAVDDVIYLGQIYEKMYAMLEEMDRIQWLESDFSALLESKLYQPDVDQVWQKIRSANRLSGNKLSVLQALARWREETARRENQPRNWLIRDDAIIDISHQNPKRKSDLSAIKGLHENVVKRHGDELLKIISRARNTEPAKIEKHKKRQALTSQQSAMADAMLAIVKLRAEENNLNHTVLASRKEIERLLSNSDSNLFSGWRAQMIGHDLQAFIAGETRLRIQENDLILETVKECGE